MNIDITINFISKIVDLVNNIFESNHNSSKLKIEELDLKDKICEIECILKDIKNMEIHPECIKVNILSLEIILKDIHEVLEKLNKEIIMENKYLSWNSNTKNHLNLLHDKDKLLNLRYKRLKDLLKINWKYFLNK